MNYQDGINLSKNFVNTFKEIKNFSILFLWLLPVIFALYLAAFIVILIKALFYVGVEADIEHDKLLEVGTIHLRPILIIRSIITFLLNLGIYCVGALYDIFRIIFIFDYKDTYFLK